VANANGRLIQPPKLNGEIELIWSTEMSYDPEQVIRNKPNALLAILRKRDGREIARCKICYVGFVGEANVKRAIDHIRRHTAAARRHQRSMISPWIYDSRR
jgi:hypothetical protein